MDLEGIMLSEISQRKTDILWYHLYVEYKKYNKLVNKTNSLVAQWLRRRASNAGGTGSIPGCGTKTPHAWGAEQPKKKAHSQI